MKLPAISTDGTGPKTTSEKLMSYTPVFLTVLATVLAGLSSSEMTQSQYYRALAAQNQSQAGDQWNFFQAKKLRGSSLENTLELVHSLGAPVGGEVGAIQEAAQRWQKSVDRAAKFGQDVVDAAASDHASAQVLQLAQTAQQDTLEMQKLAAQVMATLGQASVTDALAGKAPVATSQPAPINPGVQAAIKAIDDGKPEDVIKEAIDQVKQPDITTAMQNAQDQARQFSKDAKDGTAGLGSLKGTLERATALGSGVSGALAALRQEAEAEDKPLPMQPWSEALVEAQAAQSDAYHQFTAARLRSEAARYAAEAQYNMATAQVYEVQVRKSGFTSDRHRTRSKHFFYGMLGAQTGVTIATFALAMKRKSLLWTLAAAIGVAALGMGGYAYMFI